MEKLAIVILNLTKNIYYIVSSHQKIENYQKYCKIYIMLNHFVCKNKTNFREKKKGTLN